MTVQVSLIGLGQIGASIGLALSQHKHLLRRTGFDSVPQIAAKAKKMGAVDRFFYNLPDVVADADIVIICLPSDQIKGTLEIIAPCLKEETVIMDTSPVKATVSGWMKELLPERRYYVGLTPVINPLYLHDVVMGIDAARADLFVNSIMMVVSPPGVPGSAIKNASDVVRLLGTMPVFSDVAEVDGLMAATHILPQLMAVALLNATVDQPGWRDGGRMAGRAYAEGTAPAVYQDESHALGESALMNRENVTRVLDTAIASLKGLREDIASGQTDDLNARLARARKGREDWWAARQQADWVNETV